MRRLDRRRSVGNAELRIRLVRRRDSDTARHRQGGTVKRRMVRRILRRWAAGANSWRPLDRLTQKKPAEFTAGNGVEINFRYNSAMIATSKRLTRFGVALALLAEAGQQSIQVQPLLFEPLFEIRFGTLVEAMQEFANRFQRGIAVGVVGGRWRLVVTASPYRRGQDLLAGEGSVARRKAGRLHGEAINTRLMRVNFRFIGAGADLAEHYRR